MTPPSGQTSLGAEAAAFYRGRRVLVCGGAGFLGAKLVAALLAAGARVVVLDPCHPATGCRPSALAGYGDALVWHRTGVEDGAILSAALAGCDFVIDAMGLTRHHVGLADPLLDLALNHASHLHLLTALLTTPRPVLLLGSRCQFGDLAPDTDEDAPQRPLDPQGVHKAAAEQAFRIYAARNGLSVLSARLGNCFGPGQPLDGDDIGLVGGFIRTLCQGGTVALYGGPERERNLAYAPDAARWLLEAGARLGPGFDAVNMFGQPVRLGRLLESLVRLAGHGDAGYAFEPFPAQAAIMDVGAVPFGGGPFSRYVPDPRPTDLETALERTVEYFMRNTHALAL